MNWDPKGFSEWYITLSITQFINFTPEDINGSSLQNVVF